MTRVIAGTQRASSRTKKGNLLGLSVVSLSGFHICQMVDKKPLKTSLAERKILKEIVWPKKKR
ncbi:MAG: hypothetical protein KAT96_01855 [Candidatus Omnitrophica bacterium]|nr:hypothetical protein [Candidatus Omnitrophota bacterium]